MDVKLFLFFLKMQNWPENHRVVIASKILELRRQHVTMATDTIVQDVVIVTPELVVQDDGGDTGEHLGETRMHEPATTDKSQRALKYIRISLDD